MEKCLIKLVYIETDTFDSVICNTDYCSIAFFPFWDQTLLFIFIIYVCIILFGEQFWYQLATNGHFYIVILKKSLSWHTEQLPFITDIDCPPNPSVACLPIVIITQLLVVEHFQHPQQLHGPFKQAVIYTIVYFHHMLPMIPLDLACLRPDWSWPGSLLLTMLCILLYQSPWWMWHCGIVSLCTHWGLGPLLIIGISYTSAGFRACKIISIKNVKIFNLCISLNLLICMLVKGVPGVVQYSTNHNKNVEI